LVILYISAYTADAKELSEDIKGMYTCLLHLRSLGIFRSAEWQLHTDVSVQHINPIFKRQAAQQD
jgi:hypothetical protein